MFVAIFWRFTIPADSTSLHLTIKSDDEKVCTPVNTRVETCSHAKCFERIACIQYYSSAYSACSCTRALFIQSSVTNDGEWTGGINQQQIALHATYYGVNTSNQRTWNFSFLLQRQTIFMHGKWYPTNEHTRLPQYLRVCWILARTQHSHLRHRRSWLQYSLRAAWRTRGRHVYQGNPKHSAVRLRPMPRNVFYRCGMTTGRWSTRIKRIRSEVLWRDGNRAPFVLSHQIIRPFHSTAW